jgi:hypothetical protein
VNILIIYALLKLKFVVERALNTFDNSEFIVIQIRQFCQFVSEIWPLSRPNFMIDLCAQNAGNGISGLQISKIFRTPLVV